MPPQPPVDFSTHHFDATNATLVSVSCHSDCGPIAASADVAAVEAGTTHSPQNFHFRPDSTPYNSLNRTAAGVIQVPVIPLGQGRTTVVVTFYNNSDLAADGLTTLVLTLNNQADGEAPKLAVTRTLPP